MPADRRVTRRLLAVLVGLVGLLALAAPLVPAAAADDDSTVPPPPAGEPWFGPGLDWTTDTATAYADRLGEAPSLYAQRVHYPLEGEDVGFLRQFVEQATSQGAAAVVSLEPQVALADLDAADARRLREVLADLERERDAVVLLRFAPEMNGSWVTWGQQPEQYVRAFREVAEVVHDGTERVATVWSPAYGAGYPFGEAFGEVDAAGPRAADLDLADPYGPYWPGGAAVDWVGLSLYRFGDDAASSDDPAFGDNTLPEPGELEARLDETLGYGDDAPRSSFYERFAERRDLPMLVETGALFNTEADAGPGELAIKQAWWRQVFAAVEERPAIRAISWLELTRSEAEADDDLVRWSVTEPDGVADAFRADLEAAPLDLDPVSRVIDQESSAEATAQGRDVAPGRPAGDVGAEMGWLVLCVVLLGVLYLLAGVVGRVRPQWRYEPQGSRDDRLDLFRGWIIIAVVVTHIEVGGAWSYVTLNAVGAITGAEMFVLLSGLVLGMVYAPTVRRLGEWGAAVTAWRRARKLYVTALVVVLLVPLLGLVPGVTSEAVTTFTDRGTGENGTEVAGQVYDLYPNLARLLDYPPPWYAVRQLLLLEIGPWVFNIMGLFVVLSLLVPLAMWLIRRGAWWLLLAGSWTAYAVGATTGWHPLPSQFEYVFPLLLWQLPFLHGLVIGHYRQRIVRALTTRTGVLAVGVVVVGYATFLGWLWIAHRTGIDPLVVPPETYGWLYDNAYTRVFLRPGRLLDLAVLLVVAYAVLTTCWKPVDRLVGWFWTPLGSNSLYVFVVHVFFVVAVASLAALPWLPVEDFWVGTLVHTVVVLAIWAMVRRRVLFKVIPR
ncbi:hypothetical protein GCM10023226_38470 [Nocardioides nanhaiensis]|uniref:GH26 domain-containing protein n=1 Tax=Nocardioides nanhaiensis TaxID=1476871 RepID=A0ABP8WVR0_9ACTN